MHKYNTCTPRQSHSFISINQNNSNQLIEVLGTWEPPEHARVAERPLAQGVAYCSLVSRHHQSSVWGPAPHERVVAALRRPEVLEEGEHEVGRAAARAVAALAGGTAVGS